MKLFVTALLLSLALKVHSQKAEIIKLGDLQKLVNAKTEKIQVINFWATWCAPCVKELPLFEKLNGEGRENISITLVSLDLDLDPNPEKVYKFISHKNIQSQVMILDEQDPDKWIGKIEKQWSGALPATIVVNQKTGQRKFVGKELHEGDLERLIAEVQ
jgi:thiol-disulfide isomerase/thioredoxin